MIGEPSATSVVLAAGSLGTAGNGKITGLTSGTIYKVRADTIDYYVKADGTLSTSASDAAPLTGTEITGLTNGVDLYGSGIYSPAAETVEADPTAVPTSLPIRIKQAATNGASVVVDGKTQTAGGCANHGGKRKEDNDRDDRKR